MRVRFHCLYLSLLFTNLSTVWAFDPNDIFQHSAKMPAGPLKGQPLDVEIKRSAIDLSATKYARYFAPPPGYILVGNIYHDGEFFIGWIPQGASVETTFLFERFQFFAYHVMMKFKFEDNAPAILVAPIPTAEQWKASGQSFAPPKLERPILLDNILLSIEAVQTIGGGDFNLIKGMKGYYANSFRLVSTQAKGFQMLIRRHPVHQYEINLTPAESIAVLLRGIEIATERGLHSMYNTAFDSCYSGAMEILEAGAPILRRKNGQGILRSLILKGLDRVLFVSETLPGLGRLGLTARGYMDFFGAVKTPLEFDPSFTDWLKPVRYHPKFANVCWDSLSNMGKK